MAETMRKLKSIPMKNVSQFLAKNNYKDVKCSEYQLGKGEVDVNIDSINDSFTGTIKAKKQTLMNAETGPVLDDDVISFECKNGQTDEVSLAKRRVDSARGYIYLHNVIDEEESVYKTKAILNQSQEVLSFTIDTVEKSGKVLFEEVNFDKNGEVNVCIEASGKEKNSNYRNVIRFKDGEMETLDCPDTMINLETCHFGMYAIFDNLKQGNYGFHCNEEQLHIIDNVMKTMVDRSPFCVDKLHEIVNKTS